MNKPYHLVVFDWEGTLGDTLGKVINALHAEVSDLGLQPVDDIKARYYLMSGLVVGIKKLFPQLSAFQQDALTQAIQRTMSKRKREVFLLPGAQDIIKKINQEGILLAIASNRGQQSLQRDLQDSKLANYFAITRTASQLPAKPCPDMLAEIIDYCGVHATDTLMIGDSISDIEMAQYLQVDAIGVNFYHQQEQENELIAAGAKEVFDNYSDVAAFLNVRLL